MIAVAARHYSTLPSILRSLSGAVSRLLWATVADVPQSYYVVKALCILCIWPLPISSTSADPTFMIAGLVMQISMQIGLHRPSHAQDFSKFKVELRDEELRDRVKTWAACNVVAQRYDVSSQCEMTSSKISSGSPLAMVSLHRLLMTGHWLQQA